VIVWKYIINVLIATDQWFNTVFFGAPDETISSRLGRNHPNSAVADIVNTIFFWEPKHCQNHVEPIDREEDQILK
jgi:hypothetical protein